MRHPRHNDGFRACRRTGPMITREPLRRGWVTVYDAVEQGIEDDPATPWAVVCEEHCTVVCVETRRAAEDVMRSGSTEFCDDCREQASRAVRRQCAKCPWKVSTDPHEIPDGYSEELHCGLRGTIASGLDSIRGTLRIMACHESRPGREVPCVGWLADQLGPGNNLGLRLAASRDPSLAEFELDGPQHEAFDDTLPEP